MHDNDASKKIVDEALEQIDILGAFEATKKSPRAEKAAEDENEKHPKRPF